MSLFFPVFSARAASSLLYLVRKQKPHTCQWGRQHAWVRLLAEDSDFLVGQVDGTPKLLLACSNCSFDLFQLVASKFVLMLPAAWFKVRGSSWHCHISILATLRDGSDGILNVVLWHNPPPMHQRLVTFSLPHKTILISYSVHFHKNKMGEGGTK